MNRLSVFLLGIGTIAAGIILSFYLFFILSFAVQKYPPFFPLHMLLLCPVSAFSEKTDLPFHIQSTINKMNTSIFPARRKALSRPMSATEVRSSPLSLAVCISSLRSRFCSFPVPGSSDDSFCSSSERKQYTIYRYFHRNDTDDRSAVLSYRFHIVSPISHCLSAK